MWSSFQRILLIVLLAIAAPVDGHALESAESALHMWTFDNEPPKTLPSEFKIGTLFDGRPAGKWTVLETDRAKSSPRVLGQLMAKGA